MRLLNLLIVVILLIAQVSCSNSEVISSTPTFEVTVQNTDTPMPTETTLPSQTSSPAPMVAGTWSEQPSMLTAHSAHAVVSMDSAIYALAGTDENGRPVLDVETFDGKQWKVETMLPGEGLNAPTASVVGNKLFVMGGFKLCLTNLQMKSRSMICRVINGVWQARSRVHAVDMSRWCCMTGSMC